MPKTSVAVPVPPAATPSSVSTAALAKQVNTQGLCTSALVDAQNDPWFPVTRIREDLVGLARQACAGCSVIAECREMAIRMESALPESKINGIFGALAPQERIDLIRAHRAEVRRGGHAITQMKASGQAITGRAA